MRAYEIINEAFIGSIFLPNVELSVNTHAYDQADVRRITYELVDQVVKKANSVASELSKIGPNEEVYVYDPETRVSLGLRREAANKMKFQFNTVLGNRPHPDGRNKIIDIPGNAAEVKVMNSFVNIGRNTVRKVPQGPLEPVAKKTGGGGGGGSSGGGMGGGGGLGSGGRGMSGGAGMLNPDPLAQLLR